MKSARFAVLLAACTVPACTKPAPTPTPATAARAAVGPSAVGPAGAAPTPVTPADEAAARDAGHEFLTALKAGKATAAQLTPEFKAVVAAGSGAADWAAQHWLDEFKGDAAAVAAQAYLSLDDGVLVAATAIAGAGPKPTTYCKVVRVPGASKYAVAWVHSSPSRPPVELSGDTAARFAGVAFVDTVLNSQPRLAESLLAPAALKRLAPPLDDDDAKLGYSRGILAVKLAGFRENFTSVAFAAPAKAADKLTLTGELTGPGAERRKFTVTIGKAEPGWLVEDFRHD